MTTPLKLARAIGSRLKDPALALLPYDGTRACFERGAAYQLALGTRRFFEDHWFWSLPHLQAAQKDLAGRAYFAVYWPALLEQGKFPVRPLGALAHQILEFLLPVVEQFDCVLADDFRVFRKNYADLPEAEKLDRPLYLGQVDAASEDRFTQHLTTLLRDRRFLTCMRRSLERSLTGCAVEPWHAGIRREETEADLFLNTTFLRPDALAHNRGFREDLVNPEIYTGTMDPLTYELRRLSESFSGTDGCWRISRRGPFGDAVLVDWRRVLRVAWKMGRVTPWDKKKPLYDEDYWNVAVEVKGLFAQRYGDCTTVRPTPLYEVVKVVTGEDLPAVLEHPWEIYSLSKMRVALDSYYARRAMALKLHAAKKLGGPPQPPKPKQPLLLDYNGTTIQVVRRGDRTLFQVPYEGALEERWYEPLVTGKHHYKIDGAHYWTIKAINMHANGYQPRGMSSVEGAEDFRKWAELHEVNLDGKGFIRAMREQTLGERISKRVAGKLEHLGAFTDTEKELLRTAFAAVPAGPMSPETQAKLLEVLPGRSINAIRRMRDELGFDYAVKHGYAAYAQSGFCPRRSVARRAAWLKKGVRP